MPIRTWMVTCFALVMLLAAPHATWALASNNVPLDSPIYLYLDKLAGFGLITSEVKGLRPYSRAEAARLLLEAEHSSASGQGEPPSHCR